MYRIGRYTVAFESNPKILSSAASVGKSEGEGPLAQEYDYINKNDGIGCGTWEHAEAALVKHAVQLALDKAKINPQTVDIVFAGDLLNQCTASTFGFRDFQIPLAGLFGACSTFALALYMAAASVDACSAEIAIAEASSHFCSAEKQFRFPLEYGGQRTLTAQRTVTGAGAAVIGKKETGVIIKKGIIGRITDYGIKDMSNMGAAMAPAAAATINAFLKDTDSNPTDYDMILTGDLGFIGSDLLIELMREEYSYDISQVHADCGKMIFYRKKQDVHAGGSGCGCSAAVVCTKIMHMLEQRKIKKVLFAGTGALMSPLTTCQGDSIPCIAHAVLLENEGDKNE